jgi:hypothetical protein
MKTKSIIYSFSVLTLASVLLFSGCKKRKEFNNETGQSSEDNRNAISENDNAISDVNNAVGNQTTLHGRAAGVAATNGVAGNICGCSVDTTNKSQGSITLNYDGTTCNNRTRTGSIKISVVNFPAMKWKMQGCSLKVEYTNYQVTRASDGKFVKLNGTQYITNETGGTWWELLIIKTQSSLATDITTDALNVTFEDGKTAVYNIHRRFTYTIPNNIITCTGEGTGSSDGLSNLENYGTTRDGDSFTSQVTTPIVWNITCGPWAPTAGAVDIKVKNKDFDLRCTFAVDSKGNPVDVAPNTCAYGWKVEWSYKKKTNKKIFGYI